MTATLGLPTMAGAASEDDRVEGGTKMVRLDGELVDKLSWVLRVRGGRAAGWTTSIYLEPLIRKQIEADFAEALPEIRAMQKAVEKHRKKRPSGE